MREFAWLPVSWVDLSSRFLLHFPGACISVCVAIWSSLAVALEMIVPIRKLTPAEADSPAKKVPAIAGLRGGTKLQRPAQHRVSSLLAPASAVVRSSTFAGTSGLQASVSEQLQRGAPRTGPTSALSAGLVSRCSLKSKEDSERNRIAILWMGFADSFREDSCLLDDSSGLELQSLKPLFLDRAPSTLKRHLCGWKLWVSFCLTLDCRAGCPSLCQLLDFLDALSEGSFTDRGRQRKRSAPAWELLLFQLSSLTKVLENPLVLAWKQADKWHRSRVKEALPLPLIVVQRLEAAVLGEPGEDRLLLCAMLAMVWGSLCWSDVQSMALDSVVLDDGALMGWC